jgi:DnaJ-class molecular chaperone
MKITCAICKGHGWADTSLATVGTKPMCKMCNGIGTINVTALQDEIKRLREKLDRIRENLQETKHQLEQSGSLWSWDPLITALIEAGSV